MNRLEHLDAWIRDAADARNKGDVATLEEQARQIQKKMHEAWGK